MELPYEGIEFHSGANVNIAFLRASETLIELLEPLGEGLHHIAMEVDDVVASLENLKSKNTPPQN